MTNATVQHRGWPRSRWFLVATTVMVGQVGLISWLSSPGPAPKSIPMPPRVELPPEPGATIPGIPDPALFVLPSVHGFSGPAWLQTPPLHYDFPDWTEAPRWLPLDTDRLGSDFSAYMATNSAVPPGTITHAEPTTEALSTLPQLDFAPTETTVTMRGPLARRRLLQPLALPAWPATDMVLSNTEILAGVARNGVVFSAVVASSCGTNAADNLACEVVRTNRFAPLPIDAPGVSAALSPAEDLTWGRIIIRWLTVAAPATNPPPGP
jgi:hypothetical protein